MAATDEDIVITGLSARFPQADSLVDFKEKLYAGFDFVTDDESRWPRGHLGVPERMGKIRDPSLLDAAFFGVAPKQAHTMDPQMRLLLETSYEAIVDAGYDPATLRGRMVGVFVGCANCESMEAFSFDAEKNDGYGLVGSSLCMLANRIAYSMDFHGLNMAIDSGCSSTMTALHQAVLAIRTGQCEAAVVGGSALCLKAASALGFLRLGMLSPDGKCMSFDSRANGYVRSETVGALFIQRASEARRVYAKITHIKSYSDGYTSEGITFPSGKGQERLIRDIYSEAKVDPRDVSYVEAHGTGTKAGDKQELCAISSVFCPPGRLQPLKVGSVKSNVGHGEPASGINSVAKVILAMETGTIAGNLHFREPNPDIPCLHDGRVEVVDKNTPFLGGPVGISSFGLGGSSVHVILEPREGPHVDDIQREQAHLPRLVLMAGRNKQSLERTLHRLEEEGPQPDSAYALLNQVGQPSVKHFPYRGFALVPVDGSSGELSTLESASRPKKRPLWFVFNGMGCQWKAMARQMMQLDVFARSIRKSHEVLKQLGVDLIEFITVDEALDQSMGLVQASIIAIQVALVDTLAALGIHPEGMVGHSAGEIGCAYADGCLSHEEAVLCAYWRGRNIELENLPSGAMAALGLSWEEAAKRCRDGVVPACHNAADSVTVSGPADAVAAMAKKLSAEGVFVREVDSANVAFHSQHMKLVAPAFREALQKIISVPKPRSKGWVTSSVPETRWHEPLAQQCSAEFLVENLVAPVLFYESLMHVPKNAILVEIGPHCLLQPILRRVFGPDASPVGLMKREADNVTFFLTSLGKLHTLGVQLDLSPLYPPVPYPVPRGTPSIGHLVSWDHSQRWTVAKWNEFAGSRQLSEDFVEINLHSNEADAYLAGHQLDGRVTFPAAGCMVLAWKSLAQQSGKPFHQVPVVFEEICFHRSITLPNTGAVRFKVQVMSASGDFEVSEDGSLVMSGRIRASEEEEKLLHKRPPGALPENERYDLNAEDIYKDLRLRGYGYSGSFQTILKADLNGSCGKLTWAKNWVTFIDGMLQFCAFNNPLGELRQFSRMESCHVDPCLHAQVLQEVADEGIPILYDSCLNSCCAGGVEFRGVKTTIVQRRESQNTPLLEEYRFLPYFDDESSTEERALRLQEYIGACSAVVRRILDKSGETEYDIPGLMNDSRYATEEVIDRHLNSTRGNSGLLRSLIAIEAKINDSASLASAVQWALTAYRNDLQDDALYAALLEEDPLRPLLDVAVENTAAKKIRVLELVFSAGDLLFTPIVSKLLPLSNLLLKTEYFVALPATNGFPPQRLPEDVMRCSWDPASTSANELPDAHLITVRVLPSSSVEMEALAEQLSKHCKDHAFVLLLLPAVLTPAEVFLSKLGNSSTNVYKKEAVVSVLQRYGFSSVAVRSNNWSTLFLIRKMSAPTDAPQPEVIGADNTSFGWVETLKKKIVDGKDNPPSQNLLLVAKDCGISGVVGLMNCLRQEGATSRIRCVFDASLKKSEEGADAPLSDLKNKGFLDLDLIVNVQRNGQWGCFRHFTLPRGGVPKLLTEHAFLDVETRGDLSSLKWHESPLPYSSASSSCRKRLCSVYYAALNFRDVVIATGRRPLDDLPCECDAVATSACQLGIEFSGRDRQGRRVMGLVPSHGMATAVAAEPDWLWDVPDAWSLEEASTIPAAYSTAYYALLVRGHMQPGESLLVHSGSTDVGQAAISIALSMGCTVFATVGSQEEQEFLRRHFQDLKDRNISNYLDMSFEEHVLRGTSGRGVDLVLNSLPDEKATVRCLALRGRFLQIGKCDLSNGSKLGKSAFHKGISFHAIVLESLHRSDSSSERDKRHVRSLVEDGIKSGAVRPLHRKLFTRDQAEQAFRFMDSGNCIGKVVLQVRPEESPRTVCPASPLTVEAVARTYFYGHKSYIIVGGLGGVGLELGNWMIRRGCRKLLLSSRSGVQNGYQKLCLRRWQQAGAKVLVVKADVRTEEGACQMIQSASEMGPVGGIFNLAMVLSVALFEHQTAESFEKGCTPKVLGTRLLDEASRKLCPELDHFVVFSSVACGRGVAGQSSYGYANSVIERICEQRAAVGLPGLAIQWGPIGEVGILHELMRGDVEFDGCAPQTISSCMAVLDHFLNQSRPVVSCLVQAERCSEHREKETSLRDVAQTVADIFGIKEASSINPNMTMTELGMDSLMGVEVRRALERDFDLPLSVVEIRQLTFARLREMGGVGGESVALSPHAAA